MVAFDERGLLPTGDYPLTFEELRESVLVNGPPSAEAIYWDTHWRLYLVNQLEILVRQLWTVGIADVYINDKYRVELYPHYHQMSGIKDRYGNDLQFPAAFRTTRYSCEPKGIVKLMRY